MKKTAVVLVALLICLAMSSLVIVAAPSAGQKTAAVKVDAVASATPNYYRNFSQSYLESLPLTGGYYSCLKSKSPYAFTWQDWYGVKLADLLDQEVGLADGTTNVRLIASDGATVDLSLSRVRDPNSQGLYSILAWQAGIGLWPPDLPAPHQDPPLPVLPSTDGPFRLALGQSPNVGDYASGGSFNFNLFLKTVRAIEVQPLPAGVFPINPLDPTQTPIPADKIVVYGNIHPYGITSISPTAGPVGTEVTISGYGFYSTRGTSSVSFGAVPATDYTSWGCQQIKCKVPAGVTGTVDVTVTDPEGTSNAMPFTVNEVAPAPTVTSISPNTGVAAWTVNVTNLAGTGFQAGASVRLESGSTVVNATNVNVVSDKQITCQLTLPDPLGKYDVIVKNPDAKEGKLTQGFSVTNICGGGASLAVGMFGLMMGLIAIAGGGAVRRKRRRGQK
jgi:IPT/TIG domain